VQEAAVLRKTTALLAALAAAAATALVDLRADDPAGSSLAAGGLYAPGQVLVQLTAAAQSGGEARAEQVIRSGGGLPVRRSAFTAGFYLAQLGAQDSVEAAVRRFRTMVDVEYVVPNGLARSFFTPNDPEFAPLQWNMRLLDMERGWDIQRGSSAVAVAIVDSGVAFEDFLDPAGILFRAAPDWASATFLTGFDAVYGRGTHANDLTGHGTHVASTVAEATDNGLGVTGLAFGCGLVPVRVLNELGVGTFFDIADGIDYATTFTRDGRRAVRVINLSLGAPAETQDIGEPVRRAIERAVAAGIVVVAATGNENTGVAFPALMPEVIAVGAVDRNKRRASYSNFGPEIDVVAPGGDNIDNALADAVWQQSYAGFPFGQPSFERFALTPSQGTSMAAPHVAATAALLVSQGIEDPLLVRAAIESTAEDLGPSGFDSQFGHGLIRPVEALRGLGLSR
jgi:serine protease